MAPGGSHTCVGTTLEVWHALLFTLLWASLAAAEGDGPLRAAQQAVRDLEASRTQSPQYVVRLAELGRLYRAHGEPAWARETLAKAVRASQTIFGADHPETAVALNNQAECALETGDPETAVESHRRALAIRERAFGQDHPTTARSLNNLGLALLASAQPAESVTMLQRALSINERTLGGEHRATSVSLVNLGRAQLAVGDVEGAIASLTRARAIRSASRGPQDPGAATTQRLLAEAMATKGAVGESEQMLDEAVAALRNAVGEQHPDTQEALDALVRVSGNVDDNVAKNPGSEPRSRRRRFYVRDLLGLDWRDQLVTFPVAATAGDCRPKDAWLEGPTGPVPVQFLEAETWPDGTLRKARACFYVDLAAFCCDLYTLRFDGSTDPPEPDAQPRLFVERQDDRWTVRSTYVGAEFDLARADRAAAGGRPFPVPLVAMLDADGRPFGGSEFYGPAAVEAVEPAVLATGPVVAEFRWRYRCRGGLAYELRASLGERDTAVHWSMQVTGDAPIDGWRMWLNRPREELALVFQKKSFSAFQSEPSVARAGELDWVRVPLAPRGKTVSLAPWFQQYFDDQQTVMLLATASTDQTRYVLLQDPGAWVEPRWPRRFTEAYPGRLAKSMQLAADEIGRVALTAHCGTRVGGGVRRWAVGIARPDQIDAINEMADATADIPPAMALGKWLEPRICDLLDSRRLDRVKEYILCWPRPRCRPRLFVTQSEVAEAQDRRPPLPGPAQAPQFPTFKSFVDHLDDSGDGPWYEPWHQDAFAEVAFLRGDKTAAQMRIHDRVVHHLGLLGQIDRMRDAGIVAALYDGAIDSGVVSRAEARVLDAWMAYLCHVYADPNVLSYERGYHPGPPNIIVAYVLSLGVCACAIPDHPLARAWVDDVMKKVRFWLDEELGPEGEWFEGSHYDHVTLAQFLAFAIAMRHAGYEDLTQDPRLRLFAESLAQQSTPPDPTRQGRRVTPPLGRRVAGTTWSLSGLMSRVTADDDPAYSARMQWAWRESGNSYHFPDDRMGGTEMLLLDPALPAQAPVWKSRYFPRSGVVFRDAVDTLGESYLLIPTEWQEPLAPLQVGSIVKWFAHGAPLAGAFSDGDTDRHHLLASQVVPAFSPRDAAAWEQRANVCTKGIVRSARNQSMADYLDVTFTTPFPAFQGGAADPTPGGKMPPSMPAWPPVDRPGKGPIDWRRQVLFVKATDSTTPAYLVLRDTVRSDTPTMWLLWTLTRGLVPSGDGVPSLGADIGPARPLRGNRFTASGQHHVDLEIFVAGPEKTPRHTLRWGKAQTNPAPVIDEYQDLLHLQMPGTGSYFVVLFPRLNGQPTPAFESLASDVLRIRGAWGEDIVFIGDDRVRWQRDGIDIDAPAGLIRRGDAQDAACLVNGGRCSSPRLDTTSVEAASQRGPD